MQFLTCSELEMFQQRANLNDAEMQHERGKLNKIRQTKEGQAGIQVGTACKSAACIQYWCSPRFASAAINRIKRPRNHKIPTVTSKPPGAHHLYEALGAL